MFIRPLFRGCLVHVAALCDDLQFAGLINRDFTVAAADAALFETTEWHGSIGGAYAVDVDKNRPGLDSPR